MRPYLSLLFALSLYSHSACALSPAAIRGMRNVEIAINSVTLLNELRCGPIAKNQMQTARNLLRDLDSALTRGRGEISRMTDQDRSDQAVMRLTKRLDEYQQFRNDLDRAIGGGSC